MKISYVAAVLAGAVSGAVYLAPALPHARAAATAPAPSAAVQMAQNQPAYPQQPAPVSFKDDVQPIFTLYCTGCHAAPNGPGYKVSGLDLTTYQGVMKGTKYGPMIVPGDPDNSNLMWLLDWRASPQLRMPHGKKQLPVELRNIVRTWIRQGAQNN